MKGKSEKDLNYSKKELEDRLEQVRPLLADEDVFLIEKVISISKQPSIKPTANAMGMFMDLTIFCSDEATPIKKYDGKPVIATDSHSLILGRTRTGKTVFSNIQIIEMIKNNDDITIFVPDPEGDRTQFIITRLEELGIGNRWIYLDENTLRMNLFEPVQISPTWFTDLVEVFLELGFYGDLEGVMRNFFMDCNAVGECHRRGGFATFTEQVDYIKTQKYPKGTKQSQYQDTIAIRLENKIPSIGQIFDCRSGVPWNAFNGKCVIIDISRMHADAQIFLQVFLLKRLLFTKEWTNDITTDVFCDFDELSKFLWNHYVKTGGHNQSIFSQAPRRAGKRRLFFSFKDQIAHLIPPDISANCSTFVIFPLLHQNDLKKIQNEMNLTSDQAAFIPLLENKPVKRQCIYRSQDMKEAMLAEVEEVDLSNLLTHEEIQGLMKKKLKDLPWEPADSPKVGQTEKRKQTISEDGPVILKLIQRFPAMPLNKIKEMSGFKTGQFKNIVEHLTLLMMITEPEKLSLGKPGSSSFYTELLPSGNEALGLDPNEPHLERGKNKSLLARVMLTILAKYHEWKGIKHKTEYRSCDMVTFLPDGRVSCFEVETYPDTHQIAVNISRNINELNPVEIVVIFETKEQTVRAREVAESRLSKAEMERVRFDLIKNYLPAMEWKGGFNE